MVDYIIESSRCASLVTSITADPVHEHDVPLMTCESRFDFPVIMLQIGIFAVRVRRLF